MAKGTEREIFSTMWGTALSLLGIAIGLGNFWRFPYMLGIYGGGAFLLVYLLVVIVVGVPAMIAEMALGRATRRGPVGGLTKAGLPLGRGLGYLMFVAVAMAMSYYLVILGWILAFLVLSGAALFGVGELSAQTFSGLQVRPLVQLGCAAVVGAAVAAVVARGVRRGIERVSRWFLPAFMALCLLLVIRALSLPGAADALRYLLQPDWSALTPRGVLAATGQAFFSLGLGGTLLVIYGSYMPANNDLARRALMTAAGDVAASIVAVLVVMPLVFSYGLSPAAGPALLFQVLPQALGAMPGGSLLAVIFFAGLGCVAFLSGVAAIEFLVGSVVDDRGWQRGRSAWWITGFLLLLAVPATRSLDYLFLSDLIWGSTMLPAGSVAAMAALTWGLGRTAVYRQLSGTGEAPRWFQGWYLWIRYVAPAAVVTALVSGWLA